MRKTYKNALMWALYGVLFLFMTVFQTVTFGRMRLFGVKLSLIPVTAACIAMHVGGEVSRPGCSGVWPGRRAARSILCCWRSAARLWATCATGICGAICSRRC